MAAKRIQKRPLSIREIQAAKSQQHEVGTLLISNISKQKLNIHLRPPVINGKRMDFYVGAQDIALIPGQSYPFKKDRLWMEQVNRLRQEGKVAVLADSDIAEQKKKDSVV